MIWKIFLNNDFKMKTKIPSILIHDIFTKYWSEEIHTITVNCIQSWHKRFSYTSSCQLALREKRKDEWASIMISWRLMCIQLRFFDFWVSLEFFVFLSLKVGVSPSQNELKLYLYNLKYLTTLIPIRPCLTWLEDKIYKTSLNGA